MHSSLCFINSSLQKYDRIISPSGGGWSKYGTIDISDIPNFQQLVLDENLIIQQYYFGKEGSHWDNTAVTITPSYNKDTGIITMQCSDSEGYYSNTLYKAYIFVIKSN